MQLTVQPAEVTDDGHPTGFVRLRGRAYPLTDLPQHDAKGTRKRPEQSSVASTLRAEISSRLPFHRHNLAKSVAELTEVYVQSLQVLEQCRKEIEELIPYLCEANLEFRAESTAVNEKAKDKVLRAKLSEMIAKTQLELRKPANVVTARLLALPLERAEASLSASIEHNLSQFVDDFLAALESLVDQRIAGLVEWTSQNTCQYHFFRDVVVQERVARVQRDAVRFRSEESETGWFERTVIDESGTHTHRWARHEHHTTEAFETTIAETTVVMPPAVSEFVSRIPEWLRPVVRVIDGKLAREIIVERDLKTESWEQTTVEDTPVFGAEPAVAIDHVVLTGWGPREIDAELKRRREQRTEADLAETAHQSNQSSAVCGWMTGVSAAVSLWMFWQSDGAAIGIGIAAAPLIIAVVLCVAARTHSANATGRQLQRRRLIASAGGLATALGGVGLLMSLGWLSIVFGLTTLAMTICGLFLLSLSFMNTL